MIALNRRDGIATTGITTAVAMVVAAMSPRDARLQPLLRLLGITCVWLGQFQFLKIAGSHAAKLCK
jgi:hypothetical protein